MVVQHNLRAMNSNRMLNLTTAQQSKSTERLSSGYKINRAADDAAGLSISEKMRKQVRGLTQASANAQDGISAVQTTEGALTEVHDMLQRMNELAVKASNGTQSETDRSYIQNEIDQLVTEIDRVSTTTKFNEIYLLKGDNNGTPASLTYTTADANVTENFGVGVDAAKGTFSLEVTAEAGADTGLTDGEGEAITATTKSVTVGDFTYTLVSSCTAGATVVEAAKGIAAADDTGNTKTFTSEDDMLAAIKSDNDKNGDVKGLKFGSATAADGAVTPVIEGTAFADLNNALNISLHVGADSTSDNKIDLNLAQLGARGLGVNGVKVDGKTSDNADKAIDTISMAIQKVSTQRSALGAAQNRLEHTINNLDNIVENTTAAESAIRDTDMATEMVKYSNNNILSQAGQAMLAQANQANQGVLSLLQ